MILNLKNLKTESINNVLNIIRPNVYMASIDLKDAFFSVPIHSTHQKCLKFTFGELFQFTCVPNGYGPAMRVFTKISKVPFGHLRSMSHNSVVYKMTHISKEIHTRFVLIIFQTPLNY